MMQDWIIIGILAVLVVLAIISMIRQKKKGKHLSCGGDCQNCPMFPLENDPQKQKCSKKQ